VEEIRDKKVGMEKNDEKWAPSLFLTLLTMTLIYFEASKFMSQVNLHHYILPWQ
jgi:hypothetical protein